MGEAMSAPEFKRGILKLANHWMERCHALQIFSAYMDASEDCQRDLSDMLRKDLKELSSAGGLESCDYQDAAAEAEQGPSDAEIELAGRHGFHPATEQEEALMGIVEAEQSPVTDNSDSQLSAESDKET